MSGRRAKATAKEARALDVHLRRYRKDLRLARQSQPSKYRPSRRLVRRLAEEGR